MEQKGSMKTTNGDDASKARSCIDYWGTEPSESLRGLIGRNYSINHLWLR